MDLRFSREIEKNKEFIKIHLTLLQKRRLNIKIQLTAEG